MKKLVLSIALVGFGTFAMAQSTTNQSENRPRPNKEMMQKMQTERLAKMKEELNLTDDQVSQIKALQEKQQTERKAEQKEQREEMKARRENMNAEMKKILTAEQYTKWQNQEKERMQNMKNRMPMKKSAETTQSAD